MGAWRGDNENTRALEIGKHKPSVEKTKRKIYTRIRQWIAVEM